MCVLSTAKTDFQTQSPQQSIFPGRRSLSKLGAVAMKKATFQFLSSTLSGSRHMLALALDGTIMNGWQGCSCRRKWKNEIIYLSFLGSRQTGKEICGGCSGRGGYKKVCDLTCCSVLPGTTSERITNSLNIWLRIYYCMHEGSLF